MFRNLEPPKIRFEIEPITERLPQSEVPDFLQRRLAKIQAEVQARLATIAAEAKVWKCNNCGADGPIFEGMASDVSPVGWLTGEVDLGLGTASNNVFIDLAICPACREQFETWANRFA